MIPKDTTVVVMPTPPALRTSLPAANWIEQDIPVRLMENCPSEDTLDVIDVEHNGKVKSIYAFSVVHVPSAWTSPM